MKTAAPVTIAFKNPGRSVVLLGGVGACDNTRFGGTQYAKEILKQCGAQDVARAGEASSDEAHRPVGVR